MKIKIWLLLFAFTFSFFTKTMAQSADLVLFNGKIFTSDKTQLFVQALAIKGNKILSVGSNEEIKNRISKNTRVLDLKGKTVVPGFNDAHYHLAWLNDDSLTFKTEFSVPGINKKELLDSIKRILKIAIPGKWVQATIGLTVFNDTSIRRRLLDSIAPNNPIGLQVMWGHGMIVNSMALKECKINETDPNPLGGIFEIDPKTGLKNGLLYEYAQYPFWKTINISQPASVISGLKDYGKAAIGYGITTVQDMNSTLQGNDTRFSFSQASLPLRVRIIDMRGTTSEGRDHSQYNRKDVRMSNLTYLSGIKYVIDGTNLEQMALVTQPYSNRSGWYGKLNFPVDTIKQILKEALENNNQLLLHIVGDSSTLLVLRLMKQMASPEQWRVKRVRIEHGVAVLGTEAIDLVQDLGVIIIHTPQYGFRSPLKTWISKGIYVAIGPDGVINPYLNILLVTTKQRDSKENISREEAIMAYTKESAYAEFSEKYKGTLVPGKVADLSVLSQDIFLVSDSILPSIKSLITIINGKIVLGKPTKL